MRLLAVCLFLLMAAACKDNTEKEVAVPAKACYAFPSELIHGEEGTFDASCSSADSYTWYFGDGKTSNDAIAKHTFLAPGKYSVNLTVFKGDKRDDIYGYIDIKNTGKETQCRPSYVTGLKMWPEPNADSVVFVYATDKKVKEVQWYINRALKYTRSARFVYDGQGKISSVNFYKFDNTVCVSDPCMYLSAPVEYDANGLPTRIQFADIPSNDQNLTAEFTHNADWRLTDVKYSQKSTGISAVITTSYTYDAYGNTVDVTYSGSGGNGSRENTAFHSTLTFYAASPELKFFFEYVVGIEPYVNSLKWATVKADRGGPGWDGFKTYTDPDVNNAPGLDREYDVTIDPNTNLPVGLKPNTEDFIGTDLTYKKVVYGCDL